ncbi:hypothetical protein V9T40_000540 [Parthenolecanium corni]|uniref:VPS37 C-terminal domain-containing protein n=1 Tax=Parthenolecanium corni TaxID=536013 RepID=A0AAN9Y0H3_9HEMI
MNFSAPFCTRFTSINNDRKRQIDTLKVFNDNVTEITENTEYMVEFNAGDNKLAMLILLSPDFPMEKPLLKITPSISHQWVNENSEIVAAPGFLNFTVYSDLGRVVQAIIRDLQRNPPPLRHKESPVSVINRSKNLDHVETNSSSEDYEQSFEVMSSVIGRLHKMTVEELMKLDENEESLDQFISELPHVKSLKQTVTDMINCTDSLNMENIECKKKIHENEAQVEEKRAEYQKHSEKYENLYEEYRKLAEIRAPKNVKKRLKQKIASLDAESETVAENFLESNMTMDEFLTQYKALRMEVHALKVKEDQVSQRMQMDGSTP